VHELAARLQPVLGAAASDALRELYPAAAGVPQPGGAGTG
jgi:hypothetical protein